MEDLTQKSNKEIELRDKNNELANAEIVEYKKTIPPVPDPTDLHSLIAYYRQREIVETKSAEICSTYEQLDPIAKLHLENATQGRTIVDDLTNGSGEKSYELFKEQYLLETRGAQSPFEKHRGKQKFHQGWADWWKLCANLTVDGKSLSLPRID